MPTPKVNDNTKLLFFIVICFVLLMLSMVNIKNYFSPKTLPERVLGAETHLDATEEFWNDFLNKNPNYVPGWIELGRMDKALTLDPNFQL